MLWLGCHLPRLPLEALAGAAGDAPDRALTVMQGRGSRAWVVASGEEALHAGMDRGLARVRRPELREVERQPACELQALETLACLAYRYGHRIAFESAEPDRDFGLPRFTLWVEIGASLKLFGGLTPLLARFAAELAGAGHRGLLGVAPNQAAAAAFARAGARPVQELEELSEALTELPLRTLALDSDALDALHGTGLRTLGELLALPRDGLAKRFDRGLLRLLDQMQGLAPEPHRPWRPPARFARRVQFLDEIEHREGLMFPLRRLIGELVRYLEMRDSGVQQFRCEIAHAGHDGREQPPTVIEVILSAPTHDPGLLLRVLRERFERVTLPSAARALSVVAERFAHPGARQNDLFDRRAQADEEAAILLDRLRARLGSETVWRPRLVDDHRPERAWRAAMLDDPSTITPAPAPRPRPLWLLRQPRRLSRPPPVTGTVERIESGWWDHADQRFDCFRATLEDGSQGWVRSDLRNGCIDVQGLWS